MRTIVIYPGRFQPFGPHHFLAYQQLCSKFGSKNVYVVTSNKTGIDSPLNFAEKRDVIAKYGIPSTQVVQVVNPYKVSELSNLVNSDDSVVYALGEKDKSRLDTSKPGSYFKPYANGKLEPLSENGYVYIVPTVKKTIAGYGAMSGTTLRKFLINCTAQQFKGVFGWFDPNIFSILKKRVGRLGESITLPIEIGDVIMGGKFKNKKIVVKTIGKNEKGDITINGKPILRVRILSKIVDSPINENGATKHIQHPYNNVNLTFSELQQMIESLLAGNSDITNVTEKIDGQSLSITYADGRFLAARNKTTIVNPITIFELENMLPTPEVKQSFSSAFKFLTDKLSGLSDSLLNKFFKNGTVFLHIEIVNPSNKNVIEYDAPYIIFLNMCEYDSEGEFIREMPATAKLFGMVATDIDSEAQFNIVNSTSIKLANNSKLTSKFIGKLNSISDQFKLSDSDTIGKFLENAILHELPQIEKLSEQAKDGLLRRWVYSDKSIKLNNPMYSNDYAAIRNYEDSLVPRIIKKYSGELEMLFLELGTEIIPTIPNKLMGKSPNNNQIGRDLIKTSVKDAIKQIQQNGTSQQMEMLKIQWNKIKMLGGIDKACACEGIVFNFKNNTYKLTGMFAPINQLLGISKYNV